MSGLDGHVAIITGGAGGIGAATARLFAGRGARVVLADLDDAGGAVLEKELGEAGRYIRHDVTDAASWRALIAEAAEAFGAPSILVNGAGVSQLATPIQNCSDEEYHRVVEVNQFGVFLGMREIVPAMRGRGGGSIVNISSVAGLVGVPGAIAYVAAKFAVTGMTKTAAMDLAPFGIRVNAVHPGVVATPMTSRAVEAGFGRPEDWVAHLPIPRPAAPEEIAEVIAFLASDAASFCTGGSFPADGGATAA